MKYALIILSLFSLTAFADSPKFVSSQMMKRNGLTDEQYEILWACGFKPSVDAATMRDIMFKAFRYQNTIEWLEHCGASNNFARLAAKLTSEVQLTKQSLNLASNDLNVIRRAYTRDSETWRTKYDSLTNEIHEVRSHLEDLGKAHREATDALVATQQKAERLDAVREFLVSLRDKSLLPTTKAIYNSIIDKIDEASPKKGGE
jgi:hypothetical protein